jgi:pSer/pThr/pTyr-binding forkhead associated (FHA) protein
MTMDLNYYLEAGDDPSSPEEQFALDSLPCIVGRGSDCGLQLDFDRISRKHARFEKTDQGLLLSDLDSTNGTFVNHERISAPTLINPGDILHFADHAFCLQLRESSGNTLHFHPQEARQKASETIIGFTAAPTGFPVQAPEFFELLNDEQITGTKQPIKTAGGTLYGHSLRARSTHPKLAADSTTLFRLAEDLGEEIRLAQMVRKICIDQASNSNLQTMLFVDTHPIELEEPDDLLDEFSGLASRYRHLALVCELPVDALTNLEFLQTMRKKFNGMEIEICARSNQPDNSLGQLASLVDYVRLSAALSPDTVQQATEALGGRARILIDGVDQSAQIETFNQAGAQLFQGQALGRPSDIE